MLVAHPDGELHQRASEGPDLVGLAPLNEIDLSGEILHYAYRDLSHHLQTMDRYTTLAARQMFEDGRTAGWWDLAVHPPAAFLRNYVLRGGFRDGVPGLIISAMNARYVGLKFAKLWELCSASTSTPPGPGAADSSKRS